MSIVNVVTAADTTLIMCPHVAAEIALMRFTPIEGFIAPLVQVNDTGVVACILVGKALFPVDLHG